MEVAHIQGVAPPVWATRPTRVECPVAQVDRPLAVCQHALKVGSAPAPVQAQGLHGGEGERGSKQRRRPRHRGAASSSRGRHQGAKGPQGKRMAGGRTARLGTSPPQTAAAHAGWPGPHEGGRQLAGGCQAPRGRPPAPAAHLAEERDPQPQLPTLLRRERAARPPPVPPPPPPLGWRTLLSREATFWRPRLLK